MTLTEMNILAAREYHVCVPTQYGIEREYIRELYIWESIYGNRVSKLVPPTRTDIRFLFFFFFADGFAASDQSRFSLAKNWKVIQRARLALTSKSFAAAWVGEHVPEFSHRGFSWFSWPAQQFGCCNLWYYRFSPSMAWKDKKIVSSLIMRAGDLILYTSWHLTFRKLWIC